MANWRLLETIRSYLGTNAPKRPSPRELEQARELRRNGWALGSFRRPTAEQQKIVELPSATARPGALSAPPPPKRRP